jgi:carboxymethylenebutenolidase
MDQRIIDLYDQFTHGDMSRRSFIDKLAALAGSTAAATALMPILQNNYAHAQTVPETDPRITAETVDIPGAQGLMGYLVKPKDAAGKLPTVIVIHENRGLNLHIRDVTRRMATEGFIALGLDYLSPMGGTPADEDKAAT